MRRNTRKVVKEITGHRVITSMTSWSGIEKGKMVCPLYVNLFCFKVIPIRKDFNF